MTDKPEAFIPRSAGRVDRTSQILHHAMAWYRPPTRWQRIKRTVRGWLR